MPAYRRLLSGMALPPGSFEAYPVIDKCAYVQGHALADLVGDDIGECFAVIASSGSTGRAAYWPQLRGDQGAAAARLLRFLEAGFRIQERRTLAIVGLALGSWIGGDMFSWALKNAACTAGYPFTTIAVGNRHDEILRVIADAGALVEQLILLVCPSAIGHLHLLADARGVALPHERLRYVVIGEPFPESLRVNLRRKGNVPSGEAPLLSVYGSADTGLLGAESTFSAAARSIIVEAPGLAGSVGLPGPAPHLFHVAAPDAYLETVGGELVVTRWQGVPLVRYNLHDAAALVRWRALKGAVLASGSAAAAEARGVLGAAPDDLPDVIAVVGRSDGCLMLCGTNISEAMLDEAVAPMALDGLLTGVYRARIVYEGQRQRLAIELEARAEPTLEEDGAVYARLVSGLGRVQPEFLDDWQNVYRRWDDDPGRRILSVSYVRWPGLSERTDGRIKNRGIVG